MSKRFNQDDYAEWKRLYVEEQLSSYEIARRYGAGRSTIQQRLIAMGIEMRDPQYPRQPLGDLFAEMTGDLAWVLGLLYSDGCVHPYSVVLTSKDEDIIQKVKVILASLVQEDRIAIRKPTSCWTLTICSIDFVECLVSYGLHPYKSFTIRWPVFLKPEHLSHFVRGCWDGDGCVVTSRYASTGLTMNYVSASELFIEELGNVIADVILCKPRCDKFPRHCKIWLYGDAAEKFGGWMYEDSTENNRMARKYALFSAVCEDRVAKRKTHQISKIQRQCYKCKVVYPLTQEFFYKNRQHSTGYVYLCKECSKIDTASRRKQKLQQ